jgi:hypothetical protein
VCLRPGRVKPKNDNIGMCYFSAIKARSMTGWFEIRLMYPSGVTCLVFQQSVVSVSWHYKDPTKHAGLVQSEHHHHLM